MKTNLPLISALVFLLNLSAFPLKSQSNEFLAFHSDNLELRTNKVANNILQTIFLDEVLTETTIYGAEYYQTVQPAANHLFLLKTYYLDGSLKMVGYSKEAKYFSPTGQFEFYYQNGEIESRGKYENGVKSGIWLRYAPDGNSKAERVYDGIPVQYYFETLASK